MKAKLLIPAALVLVAGCARPADPAPVPVTELGCTHEVVDIDTGLVVESTPVPCRQPETSGCSGSVSFRIEEDGSVTSWCGEEVSK
jgi:hypothetical protein